jgi:hypothetical protein
MKMFKLAQFSVKMFALILSFKSHLKVYGTAKFLFISVRQFQAKIIKKFGEEYNNR